MSAAIHRSSPGPTEGTGPARLSLPLPSNRTYFLRSLLGEWLIVFVLAAAFVAIQTAYPRFNETVTEGVRADQNLAPLVLMDAKESSFWRLFWEGRLPTRRDGYHGTLMAYLYMPFYSLIGPNWHLMKFWLLLFTVPGLVLTYLFTKEVFDRTTALWGLFLLIIHPHFETGMRISETTYGYMLFFSAAPLFFLAKWWNTRNLRYGCAGLFLLGLGMTTQFWYYWLLVGLGVVAALYRSQLSDRLPVDRGFRWAAHGLLSFLAGAALFVYHELLNPFQTFTSLWSRYVRSTIDSPDYFTRLFDTVRFINTNFSSLEFEMFVGDGGLFTSAVSGNRLFPWVMWACVAWLLWRGVRGGDRRLLVFPAMFLTMIPLASLQGWIYVHLFFLYPFPILIIAAASVEAYRAASGRRIIRVSLAVMAVAFWAIEARGTLSLLTFLKQHQTNYHRDLFKLADWLKMNGPGDKIVLRYGWSKTRDENYDVTLYCQVPEKRFDFVYDLEDPLFIYHSSFSGAEIHRFSESRSPSGKITVLTLPRPDRQAPDLRHWPAPVRKWFQEKGEPEVKFGESGRGVTLEVYDGGFDESVWPWPVIRENVRSYLH